MERIATITTIGDDFNTLNLTIDPPVLMIQSCNNNSSVRTIPQSSECDTIVLENPTMENGSLVYQENGIYYNYVRYENGIPSYIEYEKNSIQE